MKLDQELDILGNIDRHRNADTPFATPLASCIGVFQTIHGVFLNTVHNQSSTDRGPNGPPFVTPGVTLAYFRSFYNHTCRMAHV